MPIVEVTKIISGSIDELWKLVCDVESYPEFVESVKKVTIIDKSEFQSEVDWEVLFRGSSLQWREIEKRDPANYTMKFNQVYGDLEKFEGYWKLQPISKHETKVIVYTDFEIGIPNMKEAIDPLAIGLLKTNTKDMLDSIQKRLNHIH